MSVSFAWLSYICETLCSQDVSGNRSIIKEASTWQSKACCNLSAQRRTCLTGTPIQNRMDDLYAQIKFLRLDPFSERQVWSQHCGQRDHGASLRAKKNNGPNAEPLDTMALARVQTIMKFLTLRRTKETRTADGRTLLSLPPKYSRTCMLEFDEHEKAKYQALHMRYKSDFEDMVQNDTLTTNYATILHEILNLRLACDHPAMVDASKDAKRLKEGNADLSTAIREDGLNREKAIALFGVFRDMEAAMCSECGTDLSRTVETNGGMFMHGSAEELDGRLESAANGKGRKGVKKERAFDSSASTPSMRTGAQTPMSQDGEILPVVTKCQHLFCSPCFTRTVCPSWPSPKAGDRCGCSACGSMLSVAMDAFQLEPADFDTEGAGDELAHGGGSPSSEDSFDWGDGPEEDKKLPASASGAGGSSVDASKPSGRFEASTKIRALIADLIPFSQCNAHSKLYDPNAPRLDHWAPPPPTSADEGGSDSALQSDQPVRVVQCAPKSSVKGEGQTGDEDNDGPLPIKSVVFSQWTKMLDRIQAGLKRTGIRYRRLDGTMKRVDRGASLEAFKTDPGVEVLLVSLRAGGFGLNLVVACRAYLMDPYWYV